jgi:hypothetical protein
VAAVTQRKDCTNQSKRLHATATFTFEQFLHDFVSLDWHRIHSSEKEQQQHPKSWVQCLVPFFLRLVVRYSLLHAKMERPNIILQVFPCWDLWSDAVHDLQHGLRELTYEFFHVLPTCLVLVWFLVGTCS